MTPSFTIEAGALADSYDRTCARLAGIDFVNGLWRRSLDVWTMDPVVQQRIAGRLGWLTALDFVTPYVPRLRSFARTVSEAGLTDVVLLGMGGSSLAPEVLRSVLGVAEGFPRFRMLDSVDPEAVRDAMGQAATSLFVLASKSGSTIEPNVMAAEAERRVRAAGGDREWSRRVVAITDEGTVLHRRALDERFLDVFVNPADIGGRYSALSFFGLVPAALMGADLERLLTQAREMERACQARDVTANPGLALGAFMAAGALEGRDKLSLLLPDGLQAFGLWVEQLVAESTGKGGQGLVPIAGEAADVRWGADRIAVAITAGAEAPAPGAIVRARAAGVPMATLALSDVYDVAAEFLRWEVATATAGVLLGINPFDEPNVQQAKDATRALLEAYDRDRRLPVPEAHGSLEGARLTLTSAAEQRLNGAGALSFLRLLGEGDYFCLLAFLPPHRDDLAAAMQAFRDAVARARGCATMFGFGPRYLHSTGQLHKGGPDSGVFVIVTADADEDLAIPGEPFSFGVLEMAQAIGDFKSLDRTGRRALHLHLPGRDAAALRGLAERLVNEGLV